jgi:O-antigen/teichoic acid export membrane protein
VITTLGVVLLVPAYELAGAAFAISAGLIFINFAAMWVARKRLAMRWGDRRYLRWIIPLFATTAVGMLAHMHGPHEPGAALLGLYLVLLYGVFHGVSLLQGLHSDDRELLGHLRVKLGLAKTGAA